MSTAILAWLAKAKIDTALIDPGKPWQNGENESFNGMFRDECVVFHTMPNAKHVAQFVGQRPFIGLKHLEFRADVRPNRFGRRRDIGDTEPPFER